MNEKGKICGSYRKGVIRRDENHVTGKIILDMHVEGRRN